MKNCEKTIVRIFQKILLYEKFEKTIVRIFQKMCYMKILKKNHSNNFKKLCYLIYRIKIFIYKNL